MSDEIEVEIDLDDEIEVEVDFPDAIINSGGSIEIKNSDGSFDVITSTSPYILEDTTINVYVNGVLNASTIVPSMIDRTINISP